MAAIWSSVAFAVELVVSDSGDAIDISWLSQSVTLDGPYLHQEFQVQKSSDLVNWENAGTLIPGGVAATALVPHSFSALQDGPLGFYRLTHRFNGPGSDLSGRNLSGADLRNADLTGANLSGANLSGADLSGASLAGANAVGATLAGANLGNVILDGLNLAGVDLSTIRGMPRLNQLNAPPAGDAAALLPHLRYHPDPNEFVANEPGFPGIVSKRNAMVMLKSGTTVEQLNALLARYGAAVVACSPGDASLGNGLLMLRFSTASASALYESTQSLRQEEIVAAAAPDIVLGLTVVPNDDDSASVGLTRWKWNNGLFGATGGNWGWERARVPQMWNLKAALEKRGVAPVPTCILDNIFSAHEDVIYQSVLNAGRGTSRTTLDHGNHVAGIVAATYGNPKGIDGVNPFASLSAYEHASQMDPNIAWPPSDSLYASVGYGLIEDVRDILTNIPNVAVVNISLGFNWVANGAITNEPTAQQVTWMETIAAQYGITMTLVAGSVWNKTLFVTSAGNDRELVPAYLNNPLTYAALVGGVENIVVVEAHGRSGARSASSSIGGHVAAPGEDILSAAYETDEYVIQSGTSMAAPFVAGLAGYLRAVDPGLEPLTLIDLLRRNGPTVDAFTSVMEIDTLPGKNKEVLKMLLDIDDGTSKGSTRIQIPAPEPSRDRAFEPVQAGAVYADDAKGDGVINMADFRRWRDWFLFGDGNHSLNGGDGHIKHDANGDGRVDRSEEGSVFPRGDFNGNGKSQRNEKSAVPGALGNQQYTDLEVLMQSGLWTDHEYMVDQLPDLIDSVDITVSAENFFAKNTDYAIPEGVVHIYDVDSRQAIPFGGPAQLTPDNSLHLFTVPTGGKYYVASEPISIGDGTNVLMRSIGDLDARQGDRGAEYAVDLAVVEMTAVAETENPPLREIDSQPSEKEVDAFIGAGGGGLDAESVGARAWANDEGTFYALAHAGMPDVLPPDPTQGTTFAAAVQWQRSFVKDETQRDPTFEVKPIVLRLAGSGPDATELDAFADIVVEMRAGVSPEWQPVFSYYAQISGKAALNGNPSTFRIIAQEGDLPDKPLTLLGNFGAEYVQEKHKGTINLDGVQDGHSFEVRYRLFAIVVGNGPDNEAFAYVGDPLDYGSGIRMEYGLFGLLPRVTGYTADAQGDGHVAYLSRTNFYYLLYRGTNVDTAGLPIALKLGQNGPDEMIDPVPPANAGVDSYTIENRPLTQPLDVDGDGIDDVFELLRPTILDPLDPSDALADADGDGRTNLREYLDGTDPAVVDGGPVQLYPALLFAGSGDQAADVNNDGIVDLTGYSSDVLSVSFGQPDSSFLAPIQSDVPDADFSSGYTLAKVNADTFLDALLIVDQTGNKLQVMLGDGTGSFTAGQQYTAGNRPERVITGDVNGDSVLDAVLVNRSGWMITVLLGNGDGTFQAPINTETVFTPTDVVVAKLNADNLPDIAVTLANHTVAVFPGNGDGTFGAKREFSTGFSPQRVATGDVNGDGRADIITANQTGDGVSVLLGNEDGTLQAKVDYATGDNPREFKLADLDGDSDLDMVVGHFGADYHAILVNNGSGEFTAQTPAFTYNGGNCLLADFNRDGLPDLLSSLGEESFFSFGLPGAKFDTRSQVTIPRMSPTDFELVDMNADGWTDVVIANRASNTVEIAYGQAGGTFVPSNSVPVGPQVKALTVAALNDDSALDLAVVTERPEFPPAGSSNQLHILDGNGAGGFTAKPPIMLSDRPSDILAGDLNGDGRTDLLVMYFFIDSAAPFLAQADGSFTSAPLLSFGGRPNDYAIRDLNGDGRADLLARVFVGTDSRYRIYLADAVGALVLAQEIVPEASGSPGEFTFYDFSGDGRADLVASVADENGIHLFYYTGNADGTFGSAQTLLDDFGFGGPIEVADVNADGLADLITGSTIRLAKSGGGFEVSQTYWIGGTLPVRVKDINGDRLPDLITADDSSDSLRVLLHR